MKDFCDTIISMRKTFLTKLKKGFTLVELIVVVAILGIFASIAAISMSSIKTSTQKKAAEATIASYWKSTENYFYTLNSGFGGAPSLTMLQTLAGNKVSTLKPRAPSNSSVAKGKIYIQYAVNSGNLNSKYSVVQIVYNYNGKYYVSTDGKTAKPKNSL